MLGEEIDVEVTGLATGGDAVGRQVGGAGEGRAVFVALAAPGERVRARLVKEKARVAWAELTSVARAGEARVEPRCSLFGRCGGCQWQHVHDETQRQAKGSIVARALRLEAAPAAVAVGPSYGYRERARLTVGLDVDGQRAIGFRARRSHHVVDVPACPLLAPSLAAALPHVRRLASAVPLGTEIVLQGGAAPERADESGPSASPPAASAAAPAAEIVMAELAGRGYRLTAAGDVAEIDLRDPASWPDVAETGARPLRVPAGAFAQVGRLANTGLLRAVEQAIGPSPGRVLELFAGSGNFTRLLVARASSVVATDGDRAAVERGRRNVPEADWRPLSDLWGAPSDMDTVLCDPPREGLDARALELSASALKRLIYVSCDPQTLARDAARLVAHGFRLESATALDLMPQTHHVEVVALFLR